ncbi:MAG TPA: DUF2279 domain-containing protein [Thermoanaerobaculia bacterium]|jgi:hypothetical protein
MTVGADTSRGWRVSRRTPPLLLLLLLGAARPSASDVLSERLPVFPPAVPASAYFLSPEDGNADRGLEATFPEPRIGGEGVGLALTESHWTVAADAVLDAEGEQPARPKKETSSAPRKTRATLITIGVLAGNIASTLSGPIDKGFVPFHTTREDWFGKNTYAGGADKASHFVLYNILSRELHIAYYRSGYPDPAALWMAFATTVGAGMITEIGDSLGRGAGGSYEDVISDTLGSAAALFVMRHGLDDVWGFRFGFISNETPEPCCPVTFPGKDYSEEIYTGDLKLAGFAKRLCRNIGLARFLLVSVTYGTKGYRNSLIPYRQQQIGIEVGINFPQILAEIGVRDTSWWGRCLFIFFNAFRVPYTQIGTRYDFIHHEWHGPNVGEAYDPGPGN